MRLQTMACALLGGAAVAVGAGAARAEVFGGVDFPGGVSSFADAVVSYQPGLAGADPTAAHQGDFNALGAPDYAGVNSCASQAACSFVSLGVGGALVLRFTDNVLTGSDSDAVGAITTRAVGIVPEPQAWALMIAGFGLAGAALRRRRVAALA